MPDGPAKQAGLQPGDVIQSVDGQQISNPRELAVDIAAIKPGADAHLAVLHDGRSEYVTVKVARLPGEELARNAPGNSGHREALGLALAPPSPDMRNLLDVPDGTRGVVVRDVRPGSPADQAGLEAGDVIVDVGTHAVDLPADATREIRSAMNGPYHALALRVFRDGEPVFVGIQLGQNEG